MDRDPDRSCPPGAAPEAPRPGGVRAWVRRHGGFLSLVWLVYLVNIPLVLVFMGADPWRWWVSLLVVALFLASYVPMLAARSDRQVIGHALFQTLLASAALPLTPGANVIFIYAAAGLGYLSTVRRAAIGIAAVEAAVLLHAALGAWGFDVTAGAVAATYLPPLVFVLVIGVVNTASAVKQRADAGLRRAYDEVERLAAVAERERIARDLHDLLGHTLSVIRVKAELAARLAPADAERAAAEMREVEATARGALAEVRAAVSGYRARGLDSELASAKLALEGAGIAFRYDSDVERADAGLPPALEHALAFVLREAVTNVVRHSGASRCRVTLGRRDRPADGGARRGLELAVRDNGRGRSAAGGDGAAGNGLHGIGERLRAVGGRLELETDDGFALRAWVPLPRPGETVDADAWREPGSLPLALGGSS